MDRRIEIAFTEENIRDVAISTIYGIWSCIDWDKVDSRRAYGIWDEFGNKIKAAAMTTNSYENFVEKLARKMDVRSLRSRIFRDVSQQSEEFKQAVLKLIREETLQLVLEVRLNRDARKAMEESLKEQELRERELKERNRQVKFTEKGVKIDG
jgi:hypothetical protein